MTAKRTNPATTYSDSSTGGESTHPGREGPRRGFRFSRRYRISRGLDFQRAYRRRVSARDSRLLVFGCENGLAWPRLGLSVSRKIGGAVKRNRWKRLLREAFRLARGELPAGVDLVVIPREGVEPVLDELMESLAALSSRLAGRLKPNQAGR